MKRVLTTMLLMLVVAAALALLAALAGEPGRALPGERAGVDAPRAVAPEAREPIELQPGRIDPDLPIARFETLHITIDPKGAPLAAWQVSLSAKAGTTIAIVGIEGGSHDAYTNPPYFDQAAIDRDAVIIAGLSTAPPEELASKPFRACTVHVAVYGHADAPSEYVSQLVAAADSEGRRLNAAMQLAKEIPHAE